MEMLKDWYNVDNYVSLQRTNNAYMTIISDSETGEVLECRQYNTMFEALIDRSFGLVYRNYDQLYFSSLN